MKEFFKIGGGGGGGGGIPLVEFSGSITSY